MKNKFTAALLIIAGVLTGIIDHNWTAFAIFLIPAVVIFFSKYDWNANKYGDPRNKEVPHERYGKAKMKTSLPDILGGG